MATLEKTTNKTLRRRTISDCVLNDNAINQIVTMVYDKVNNPMEITQKEVVQVLMKTRLSYTTIARVVNEIVPNAHATKNSVNQLVRHIKRQDINVDELLKEISKDIYS